MGPLAGASGGADSGIDRRSHEGTFGAVEISYMLVVLLGTPGSWLPKVVLETDWQHFSACSLIPR